MDMLPITASPTFMSPIFSKTPTQVGIKSSASSFKPNKDLTWDVAIVTADAEVKPAITGEAIKSSRAPEFDKIIDYKK